jgi:hypothetical protein
MDLMAKKSGALTIPSVAFGKDFSPALRIEIKDPATAKKPAAGNDPDVFVQVEIDENQAWVQSQIIYNVRLFSRISMSQLGSSKPGTSDPDAIIKQLGEASRYEAFRDGVRYTVYEIRYAVFAQHSGRLEFKPMVFEGRINRGRSRSVFDQFMSSGELKRVRSDSLRIEVQAKPSNIHSDDWLPAKNISLTEEWSEDVTRLKNGEPVTRTITITAQGNMAESLPDLAETEIKGLKQYPDKAALNNQVTDQGVTSSKQIKIALIPTRAGDFTLPAISLAWWNTLIALLRKNSAPVIAKTKQSGPSPRALAKEVQKQANHNHASETKDALLAWARACWPGHSISSLADISEQVSAELSGEINALNASLYSPQHSPWQGEEMLKAFKTFHPRETGQRDGPPQPLESLYK